MQVTENVKAQDGRAQDIKALYDALWVLIERNNVPENFPEFSADQTADGILELSGNMEGLLLLAAYSLRTAIADHDGYHEHIDDASFASPGSLPLIISRLNA